MYKTQIACIIIILFIAVFNFASEKKTVAAKRFSRLLETSVIQLLFDICSVYTVNHLEQIPPLLNRVVHCFYMGFMLLLFVIGYKYLEAMIEEAKGEKIYRVKSIVIPFIAGVLGLCFLPIKYVETPKGNYSHGPAIIVVYMCVAFCVALIIRLLIKYNKDIPAKKRKAVMIAMLSEAPVALYQMIVPTSLISCLAIVLFILGFYMTVENPDARLVKLLEKETKRADIANQAKTNFLANMSHEIRTPINAVLGMNEMILRESKESTIREYARDVSGAAQSLLSIINDILDVTKIEAGKLKIVAVEYDFEGMIHDVANMISFKAKAKELEFNVSLDEKIPRMLIGDDIRVRQILVNLLNNAVKYTHEGGVKLEAELVTDTTEEASILFRVIDTGIGIKEEDIQKLFVPFERIEEKRNRNIEGTGLGMNITMQLLGLQDSELEVQSEYGKGSVFSFVLRQQVADSKPIGRVDVLSQQAGVIEPYHTGYEAKDACVLVVDDNEMNRKVFRSLLKDKKIQVEEAASGEECLKKIEDKEYDIIFMDHMMPEMDGIETFRRMKDWTGHQCQNTPVVILTANAILGAKEKYLKQGFQAFLSKPIDTQKLDQLILGLLDSKKINYVSVEPDNGEPDNGELDDKEPHVTEAHIADSDGKEPGKTDAFDLETLPVVEGLDWKYAAIHFRNQEDMLETVRLFYAAVDYEAAELEKHYNRILNDESCDSFRIKVHSMKSMSGMIGIIPLSGMAKVLEDAARNDERDTITHLTPVFLECWRGYKEKLSMFAQKSQGSKKGEDFEAVRDEMFARIRNAAEEMEVDELDEILAELKEYRFEGENKELFEQIQYAILNLDVEFLGNLGSA